MTDPLPRPCVVCLEDIEEKDQYTLDCHHTFHRPCIQEWFRTQVQQRLPLTCPTCRRSCSEDRPGGLSPEETRRLIVDGILSLPLLLEWTFPHQSIRLTRVLTQLRPQIQRFYQDPTYSLLRLTVLIGSGLALDQFMHP